MNDQTTTLPIDPKRAQLQALVNGVYDLQKLRIMTGNRIVANFRVKLGQAPGTKEEELSEEDIAVLDRLREAYKRITDGVVATSKARNPAARINPATFIGNEIIGTYVEYRLVENYVMLEGEERLMFKTIDQILDDYPVAAYLRSIPGCGPAMTGCIISALDIRRAKYPSSLWRYCGLDVGPDGRGRGKYAEHLIDRVYTNKDGEEAVKKGITYNPWIKTKLYVLAGCLLKARKPSKYKDVYAGYKHRITTDPAKAGWTKGHIHAASMRYMIKVFLQDLYDVWRGLEGLPVNKTYQEAKLGHVHGGPGTHPGPEPKPEAFTDAPPPGDTEAA